MLFEHDQRIVMTLDAGGTHFVFSAIQGCKEIVSPINFPSYANNLDRCLDTTVDGFKKIRKILPVQPVAISFAFPGPADYPRGIIGDLPNLPAFRDGVALGPMLEEKFQLPVFINNDGDLYAYGESIAGYLPYINHLLEKAGNPRRFQNLLGFTLGTGFGGGIVHAGQLLSGDNSGAGEVWLLRNKLHNGMNAEESISIRAVQREYARLASVPLDHVPSPKEIFEIGIGQRAGDRQAALGSFHHLAEVLGDAAANVVTIIDGIVVLGGGLAGAYPLFLDRMVEEMNSNFVNLEGQSYRRLSPRVFNLEDEKDLHLFLTGEIRQIAVPGSEKKMIYDPLTRVGVGISRIGANTAIAIGAYAFALNKLS